MRGRAEHDTNDRERAEDVERPDLAAWRRRHEIRRSNAAQPIPDKRRYRRTVKHRNRSHDG
ncbi:hypothetical protein IU469_31535 [Nocardia puris]|nr:hypothetical protein [Nocardia puris]MBF6213171.1 hypothetical protein [Nocardia puris]MBF6370205.1 hypothetical protein [Nocardia puris]